MINFSGTTISEIQKMPGGRLPLNPGPRNKSVPVESWSRESIVDTQLQTQKNTNISRPTNPPSNSLLAHPRKPTAHH